ncbi:hypothetical protein CC80DRAFT_504299 [Byssothecium circinans]|uniref:Subtilisin-like serine protease n=1 Tax=Byssothecium circinans TaxID=147558 RepID=A0A6A5TWH4_9PLEO|nr:hypothetical protein CC80DRAFT_504299 [Byssothecium circinans]
MSNSGPNSSSLDRLPGYPNLEMQDVEPLSNFLAEELECKELDAISGHLWLMSTQSSANISTLHRQRVKFRDIILTEEPRLHLVWFYTRIHIKPLPRYLLSRKFWQDCLLSHQQPLGAKHKDILLSALGLLRSYAYLIRYESDFRIARDETLSLIPRTISWEEWCLLRVKVLDIKDHEVSSRWKFGEIRLTRLNFYCKFLLRTNSYHRTYRQYGDYFASFYPPLLFLFGVVSILLGSMQLVATVEQLDQKWSDHVGMFRSFSFIILPLTFLLMLFFLAVFSIKIFNEWKYALHDRYSLKQKMARSDSNLS